MSDQPANPYHLCPGCGSIVEPHWVFCKFCGADARGPQRQAAAPPNAEAQPAPYTPPTAEAFAVPPTAAFTTEEEGGGGLFSTPVALACGAGLFCLLFLAGVIYLVERVPAAGVEEVKTEETRPAPARLDAPVGGGGVETKAARAPEPSGGEPTKTAPLSVLPDGPGSNASGSNDPGPGPGGGLGAGLTNSNVGDAVTRLLQSWRLGGSVSVIGVQEDASSAVADLRFQGFEFAVTNMGQLLRASEFRPPPPRASGPGAPLPSMEQMFPPRKRSYTGEGKARLTRYNDGRWVLKEVRWGNAFDGLGVNGTVEIK